MTIKLALHDDAALVGLALDTCEDFVVALQACHVGANLPVLVALLLPHIHTHTTKVVAVLQQPRFLE